jgi:hypothetical protein
MQIILIRSNLIQLFESLNALLERLYNSIYLYNTFIIIIFLINILHYTLNNQFNNTQ